MFSFSIEGFLPILEKYNLAIWPLQIVAYILVASALFFAFRATRYSSKFVLAILAFFWLFTGIVFSFLYWAPSHIFGYIFGICCVLQGLLFLYDLIRSDLIIKPRDKICTLIGIIFILYAAVGYQIFGYFLGHIYPRFFSVGLVPCPTTIFTFGIFMIISRRIPKIFLVIPFVISIGGILAVYHGIYEDIGLVIAGVLGTILILRRETRI
jgi:hypothetical protein